MTRTHSVAGVLIGLGLLVFAGVIGFDAATMRVPQVHAKVGPRIFPIIISVGLAFAALLTLLKSRSGEFPEAEGETDWTAVGIIAAGLVIHVNILKPLGFIPAGVVLFMAVALGFGSRSYVRDIVVAFAMVTAAYLGFTRFLGLQLPAGILGWFG
jgi:putative tricarboxylic transport membrane protein